MRIAGYSPVSVDSPDNTEAPHSLHGGPILLTGEKHIIKAGMWSAGPLVPTVVDHHALTVRTIKTNTDRLCLLQRSPFCPRLLLSFFFFFNFKQLSKVIRELR